MPEREPWTDTEYEVISGPYRVGDHHRDRKLRRWRYLGVRDRRGVMLWYRPPRFRRWQLVIMILVGGPALIAAFMLVVALIYH